jgi:hypothetical protein
MGDKSAAGTIGVSYGGVSLFGNNYGGGGLAQVTTGGNGNGGVVFILEF